MKRTRLALLAAALALVPAADAAATVKVSDSGWFWGNPLPQGHSLADVEFVGGRGYAVGEAGTILRTDDGGQTWSGLPGGGPSLRGGMLSQVEVVTANTAVVPTAEGCTLRRTDDGGRSFRRLRLVPEGTRCPGPIASFSFPTANVGFAVIASGAVFRTTDGGASWIRRAPLPDSVVGGGGQATGLRLRFVSAATGVAISDGPPLGRIHRTTDGGASWTQVAADASGFKAIEFADVLNGYATTGDPGEVLRTVNGGANWAPAPLAGAPTGATAGPFTEIACKHAQTCLFASAGGAPVRTTNGGITVTPVAGLSAGAALGFAAGMRAVALGGEGLTAISDDDGASFRRIDRRLPAGLTTLRATSPSLAVAFGGPGELALTTDGGRSWRFVGVPTQDSPEDASFATPAVGYALEAGGVVRTRNGGEDWQDTARLRASELLARSPEVVIAVGRGGIRRSTDAGASFRRVGRRALRGAQLSRLDSAGRAVFAFGDRALARSTNEGRSWRRIRRPTRRGIVDADFVNSRVGYLIAGGGRRALYRTSNAGRSWRRIHTLGTSELYSVSFGAARSGFVDVDDDTARVLRTTDGGRTWRPQQISPSTLTLGGLVATGPDTALTANSDGELFATTTGGDALGPSSLSLRSNRRRLRRAGRVTLTGRLTPQLVDEQVVIASLVRGRWRRRTVETEPDGSFRVRVGVRRTTRFVAQWDGDGASRGAGTRAVTVRVRR